ncbi:MAG TPA: TonB-dependent receptor, partial [Isosphaeraceae bacterium]
SPPAPQPPGGPAATTPAPVTNEIGSPEAASSGRISQGRLQFQPFLRPGEVLERVPGLVVTQHGGSGKANQYFLRGFNLDHGTDFSVFVDGVPINLPTHGHGQGYLDLNFLIPEVIEYVDFRKGPYYADVGDFSTVGTASIRIVDQLPQGIARFGAGAFSFLRGVVADSTELRRGRLLYAVETQYYDGPWVVPEGLGRLSGILKYSLGDDDRGLSLTGTGYLASWTSTDQIPRRAVERGIIDFHGAIDPTDGGRASRLGGNAQFWNRWSNGALTRGNAYVYGYNLNLFSNFTYFLRDPVHGDQFEQFDRRVVSGANLAHQVPSRLFGDRVRHDVGVQVRNDSIPSVGLRNTQRRTILATVRDDQVDETNVGLYYQNQIQWAEKVRTYLGVRESFFHFDVHSLGRPANSGEDDAEMVSPKASLILGPWAKTNFFLNGGLHFHSNDARGTTIRVDPVTGDRVGRVPGLVQTKGAEVGLRTNILPKLNSTLTLWYLNLASELVFVGDAGTTEPSRASERYGIEWTNYYAPTSWLTVDFDYSASHARFIESAPEGNFIPNSIGQVITGGPTVTLPNGLYASVRVRYFGPRPLIENNSARSRSTSLVNAEVGYQRKRLRVGLQLLNLLNSRDHDIDYYYESRLPGEPLAGRPDLHFHPVEPFNPRVFLTWQW